MLLLHHDQPASEFPLSTQPAPPQEGEIRPDIEKNESGLLPEFQDEVSRSSSLPFVLRMLSPHRSGTFMGVGAIPTKSFEPIRTRARPHPSRLRLWPQLTASPRHYSYCRIEYNARVAWPRRRREGETVGAARMVGRAKRRSLSPAGEW